MELTQDILKMHVTYCPESGDFIRNKSKSSAGYVSCYGYINITVLGKQYRAHRLAWLYMTGLFPTNDIDHIDRNRVNNSFSNLREATRSQNKQNMVKARSDSKSGVLGVHWSESSKKWSAQIRANGKRIHIGTFNLIEDAKKAYLKAKSELHEFAP